MASTKLEPGWAEGEYRHGETDDEQRMRARGGRPFKERARHEHEARVHRGSRLGHAARRLDRALAELDDGEAEDE